MEEQLKDFFSRISGSGDGSGYGSGYGSGDGDGDGYGDGDIKSINGDTVHMIDGVPTIISQIRGNVARGHILGADFTYTPTFVVKQGNKFAHGSTLRDAWSSLHEKLYDESTEEERLQAFRRQFPDFGAKYPAEELFRWHHILTGSCRQGRELFCVSHDIDIRKDEFTIHQFINLTKNSYGGETIRKLVQNQEET